MSPTLSPCPHLPAAPAHLNASVLTAHGTRRDAAFYQSALTYAHYLWQHGLAARAMLALDRALGSDLRGDETILVQFPLPYQPMAWFLRHAPPDVFIGNPRIHFQHLADRMNEPRREQRRWRTWACWQIARLVRPEFPADPKHRVTEPTVAEIARQLAIHGIPGEAVQWLDVLQEIDGAGGKTGVA